MKLKNFSYLLFALVFLTMCNSYENKNELDFNLIPVSGEASNWWNRSLADINGDGLKDIILQHENGFGGYLLWLETGKDTATWTEHLIADSASIGDDMACGDMETADVDNDGDIDVFGFVQDGEWESGEPTSIYWFENPSWEAHYIGEAPNFIKDIEKADFNLDGRIDIVVITFNKNSLQVFCQAEEGWQEAANLTITNLHEGMGVGDIDGDGITDIATNGYWLKTPDNVYEDEWTVRVINSKWNNQEGDWSRNATKNYCADIDNDGKDEVFISHSERKDYPVAWYDLTDAENNKWEEHIIDTINACHTLQVYDFDNDSDLDILAGENQMRWQDEDDDPVYIYLNEGNNQNFQKKLLTNEGIYNGLAGDLDDDGDIDILRLPGHSHNEFEIWLNTLK